MEPHDNHPNYLPSKTFLKRGGIATGLLLVILVVQTAWFRALFNKKPLPPIASTTTVGTLVGSDSNGNGIFDWEEKLWGLDPTVSYTNGVSNKVIIEQKKQALGITDADNGPENETDLLAKQLFSITTAVGQSDQATSDALNAIGAELGNGIDLKQVTNKYTRANITTVKTTTASLKAYYNAMTTIVSTYKTESAGIEVVITALETGDTSKIPELQATQRLYMNFSKQLQKVPAPIGVADYHLALMNGFYGMGQSFSYLLQLEENGVYGVVGVSIYKEYALLVDQALDDLRDYFGQYGILQG
jgi:hypothetical protein